MLIKQRLKGIVYRHKNIIISIAVNVFFLMLLFILNGFKYELSDDWYFSVNIANGNYNYTFCNYFIQLISGVLQNFIYPINAFMLLQLILGFISMTSIAYIFLDTFGTKKGILFVLLIESAFAINIYSLITFTKTAAILITAGGLMIFWAQCEKKNLIYSVLGIILAVLGSFYRFKIFYSVFAVFAFFVLAYLIYRAKPYGIKCFLKECREFFTLRTIVTLMVLVAAVFSFTRISKAIIYSDEELDYYRKYNSLRSAVVDFQIPAFEEHAEKFEELDISDNDLEMLRRWYLDDEGLANIDTLREISKLQQGRQLKTDYIINMVKKTITRVEIPLFMAYLLTVAGMLMVYRKKSFVFIGYITFAEVLLYLYLFVLGRCNYRSAFSIWFAATVCLLYSIRFLKGNECFSKNKQHLSKWLVLICVPVYMCFFAFEITKVSYVLAITEEVDYPGLEEYIVSQEDSIFALGRYSCLDFRQATQLDNPMVFAKNEAFDKCVYFGTPYYAHPSYNELLAKNGIDNLYTDLADNENLYFVDIAYFDDISKVVQYLNEQYGQDRVYDSVLVHEVEKFSIYKIVSTDKN